MVHIRRSRGVLLVILIIVLHVIIISLLKYKDHPYLEQLNLLDLKKALLKYNSLSFTSRASDDFDNNVNEIISNHTKHAHLNQRLPDSYYEIELSFRSAEVDVDIDDDNDIDNGVVDGSSDVSSHDNDVIKISDNEPYLINHYDPRFTFGILFNYLSHQIIQNEPITELPFFHWGDYVDLSQLNQFIFNPKKLLCSKFDTSAKSSNYNNKHFLRKPEHYCFDDYDLMKFVDENNQDLHILNSLKLIQSSKFTTGFHIFRSPGRQKLINRSILSKSYLNDFMTLPLSITLLLPNQKYLHLQIKQNILQSKQRLTNTDHFKQYKLNTLNVKHELMQFLEISAKAQSSTNDDGASLEIPNLKQPELLPIHKNLTEDLFIDNSSDIYSFMTNNPSEYTSSASNFLYYTSLNKSLSTQSPMKYFEEAYIVRNERNYGIGGHYDWRFFSEIINYTDLQDPVLHGLIRAWLKFTNRVGTRTWIAHGTLLGWYWDALNFPWDNDVDIQMPIQELHRLCKTYNQTVVVDFGNDMNNLRFGRYFLDCGTYVSHRIRGNGENNIDARFIDVDTGAYVDITALALSDTEPPLRYNDYLPTNLFPYRRNYRQPITDALERNKYMKAFNCRNNHFSRLEELNPLQLTIFEGEYSYLPSNFEAALKNEYGEKSLMLQTFRGYTFLPRLRNWIKVESIIDFIKKFNIEKVEESAKTSKNDKSRFALIKDFLNADYYKLLKFNSDILEEYLNTKDLTRFHEDEMMSLLRLDLNTKIGKESTNKNINDKNEKNGKADNEEEESAAGAAKVESVDVNPLHQNVNNYLRPDYYSFKFQQTNLETSYTEKINKLRAENKQHKISGVEQIKNDLQNLEFRLSLEQGNRDLQESKDLLTKPKQPFESEEEKQNRERNAAPNNAIMRPAKVNIGQQRTSNIRPGQVSQQHQLRESNQQLQEKAKLAQTEKEQLERQKQRELQQNQPQKSSSPPPELIIELEQQTDQDARSVKMTRPNGGRVA